VILTIPPYSAITTLRTAWGLPLAACGTSRTKYTPGASEEITPAPIPEPFAETVRAAAVGAHEALGCRLWSRSDFILGPDGPVWLEVNTVPGLTETSLFPQAAAAAGISYDQLMDLFVRAAVELGKNS